jgi:hypothetical protein
VAGAGVVVLRASGPPWLLVEVVSSRWEGSSQGCAEEAVAGEDGGGRRGLGGVVVRREEDVLRKTQVGQGIGLGLAAGCERGGRGQGVGGEEEADGGEA